MSELWNDLLYTENILLQSDGSKDKISAVQKERLGCRLRETVRPWCLLCKATDVIVSAETFVGKVSFSLALERGEAYESENRKVLEVLSAAFDISGPVALGVD